MYHSAEASLALDNDVWDTHLLTQSGEEDNELYWVDIVPNDNEGGFLGFSEGDNVIQAIFHEQGLFGLLEEGR